MAALAVFTIDGINRPVGRGAATAGEERFLDDSIRQPCRHRGPAA
jgi:hypothetical protein